MWRQAAYICFEQDVLARGVNSYTVASRSIITVEVNMISYSLNDHSGILLYSSMKVFGLSDVTDPDGNIELERVVPQKASPWGS